MRERESLRSARAGYERYEELRIAPQRCSLGPLPLPASAADEELVYLDPVICVTRRGGRDLDVWVRPAAQRARQKADALEEA